jgi:signal transduction histidine kinase
MPPACVEIEHVTPLGEVRILRVTVTPVRSVSGEVLGAACLIDDRTEVSKIRKEQELHGEMSAEMALELRNSLATISGYGRQLSVSRDPELARQLAVDIASEASHLDHTIGGFLASSKARAARAGSAV